MSKPHTCPVCAGKGCVSSSGLSPKKLCPACQGACVLWEPPSPLPMIPFSPQIDISEIEQIKKGFNWTKHSQPTSVTIPPPRSPDQ